MYAATWLNNPSEEHPMKYFIPILALALILGASAPASATVHDKCVASVDHPQAEVFRIGVSRADYKQQKTDCEVVYAGKPGEARACNIQRCELSSQMTR